VELRWRRPAESSFTNFSQVIEDNIYKIKAKVYFNFHEAQEGFYRAKKIAMEINQQWPMVNRGKNSQRVDCYYFSWHLQATARGLQLQQNKLRSIAIKTPFTPFAGNR